jgi:CRISPR-associated protein Cmr4
MWKGYYEDADLVFIKTITNLHVGSGKGGEAVDLPIQRDSFGFPVIYSSSLKGAIKSYIYRKYNRDIAEVLLGPDEAGDFASPISITDAYLLVFPARSLKGVYCYLTCPFLLKRFKEYLEIVGIERELQQIIEKFEDLKENKGFCNDPSQLTIDGNNILINEELLIPVEKDNNVENLRKRFNLDKELVIINDDDCLEQATRSLIRLTRVKLNRSAKTVESGPWTEEYIPSKTLFFSAVFYSSIEKIMKKKYKDNEQKQKEINSKIKDGKPENFFRENLNLLIIGGHETIGSGLVKVTFLSEGQQMGVK